MDRRLEATEAELAEALTNNLQLEAQIQKLKKLVDELEAEEAQLTLALRQERQGRKQDQEAHAAQLALERKHHAAELASKQKELDEAVTKLNARNKEQIVTDAVVLDNTEARLQKTIDELQCKLAAEIERIESYKLQLAEKNKMQAALEHRLHETESQLAATLARLKSANEQLDGLRGEMTEACERGARVRKGTPQLTVEFELALKMACKELGAGLVMLENSQHLKGCKKCQE